MKKIISLILAAVLAFSLLAIPVFAGTSSQNSISYMPKMETDASITLDGVRDDAYDSAKYINVMNNISSSSSDMISSATAEITWDGTYIYAYVSVYDENVISLKDETQPQLSDSVELYLYKGNSAPTASAVELYRIDADGNLTYYTNHGNSPTQYFGTSLSQFEGAVNVNKLLDTTIGYSVEYKIPYSLNVNDNLYFQVAVNNMAENSIAPIVTCNKQTTDTWNVSNFDSFVCCAPYSELSDITEINADITAIGTITRDNYKDKQTLINAANIKAQAIIEKYGQNAMNTFNYLSLTIGQALCSVYSMYDGVVFGDLNSDKGIDSSDALLVLQASVMKIQLNAQQQLAGDINGDNEITASDALLVLQYAVQKVDAFPVDIIFPCAEFAAPLLTNMYINTGFTLTFSSEDLVQKTNTSNKICINNDGIVGIQNVDDSNSAQTRTIINDEGVFVVNMKDKTYTMTPSENGSAGSPDSIFNGLFGNIINSDATPFGGFGYYNGLPAITIGYTTENVELNDIKYEGKVTISVNIAAEKDGSIIIALLIKDETGKVLLNNQITDISCASGVDASYFVIPSDFTLIQSN